MANPKPIPQLKKPLTPEQQAAMDSFASGANLPAVASPVVTVVEAPKLVAVEESTEELAAEPTNVRPLAAAPASAPKASSASKSKNGRRTEQRADGSEVRKVTMYLSTELDKRLSLHCVENGVDRTAVINAALEKYLRVQK